MRDAIACAVLSVLRAALFLAPSATAMRTAELLAAVSCRGTALLLAALASTMRDAEACTAFGVLRAALFLAPAATSVRTAELLG